MRIHNKIRRITHLFLSAVMMVAAVLGAAVPVMAAEGDSVYTVNVDRYFLDPQTGLSGWGTSENEAIGQGMVESAVSSTGLLEIVNGKYYLTIRIILAGSVTNVSFGVRENGGSDFNGVTAYCTQDNTNSNNTIDYSMEIPSTDCTVAGFMYVEKMGTDVVFFANMSGTAQPGSGDFAVINYVEETEAPATTAANNSGVTVPTTAAAATTAAAVESSSAEETTTVAETTTAAEMTTAEKTTNEAETTTVEETITEAESSSESAAEETSGSGTNKVLIGVIVVLAAVIVVGGGVIFSKRKKG